MKNKHLIIILLILLLIIVLFYSASIYLKNNFEIINVKNIYEGEEINKEDFKGYINFKFLGSKEIKIKEIKTNEKFYNSSELIFKTNFFECNKKINLIKVESFNTNLTKNYVKANEKYNIPDNFIVIVKYENGKEINLQKEDLNFIFENEILRHGENKIIIKWHNLETKCVLNALAYPIIQSSEYPMYYEDLETRIDITKERYKDTDCFVAHIITKNPLVLKCAFAEGQFNHHQIMSEVMKDNNAILMINGDFGDSANGGPLPIVKEGEIITEINPPIINKRTLGLNTEGHFYEVTGNLRREIEENHLRHTWTFNSGFTIINGERIIKYDGAKHPRTFIGEVLRDDDKLEYYLVVADGRRIDSKGFCHDDESEFLFEKGCYIAYNLDGGGSSEMMFDGKILNIPSDGHERKDHDFIYIELWTGE